MKLLFDHNLSPDLVSRLHDLFPGSSHVFPLELHEVDDLPIWLYARQEGFTVVSKDADFAEISMVHGFPPKLIWLRIGNCTTDDIEELLRGNEDLIQELAASQTRGILTLFKR